MSSSSSCHSRWCPVFVPGFDQPDSPNCTDVTRTFQTYFPPNPDWFFPSYYAVNLAACKLYCGQQSQLLPLQSQGASHNMAILVWLVVLILVASALASLFSFTFERGGRKVAMVGGCLFLTYISVIVFMFSQIRGLTYFDTPLYPIVGAMNVATYSYLFAGYQYGIGPLYELTSASAVVFTMFPIWTLLTVNVNNLMRIHLSKSSIEPALESARLVLAMLVLSVLWIIHSSLHRMIGYRAAWIAVLNKQTEEGCRNFLSNLWVLAAAQGHSTWRTPAGRSIALYLASLSWAGSVKAYMYLQDECKDDLILFHIMLWSPPVILTMAVLAIQVKMFLTVPCDVQGTDNSLLQWLKVEFQSVWAIHKDNQEAVISYRLGRETMEVESDINQFKVPIVDDLLAILVRLIEFLIFLVCVPGALGFQIAHWLGRCGLKWTATFSRFGKWQRLPPSRKVKVRAYKTLCENCVSEEISPYYMQKVHAVTEEQIDAEVCRILKEHRRVIRLPLLLDNIDPSGLVYLLQQLVIALNVARKPEEESASSVSVIVDREDETDPTKAKLGSVVNEPRS